MTEKLDWMVDFEDTQKEKRAMKQAKMIIDFYNVFKRLPLRNADGDYERRLYCMLFYFRQAEKRNSKKFQIQRNVLNEYFENNSKK